MTRTDLLKKRTEMRAQIRRAAIKVFAELGLEGASTKAIAEECGISKTKLHYYISSKEDLYIDVLSDITEQWASLRNDVDYEEGPEEFFRGYIARKVKFSFENPFAVKLFSGEVMRGAPILHQVWTESRTGVHETAKFINRWIEDGKMRKVDPILIQFHLWSLTELYANMREELRFILGEDTQATLDTDHVTSEITALFLNGIRV